MTNPFQLAREFLFGRSAAYKRTFAKESLDAHAVLYDLARFCRANVSTGHPDTHVAARLDGRREVWLRIQHHLHLTDEDLWALYGSPQTKGEK